MGAEWTESDINTLKKLYADGKTAGQISKVMEKSRNSIIGKLSRLGLSREHNYPYIKSKIKKTDGLPPHQSKYNPLTGNIPMFHRETEEEHRKRTAHAQRLPPLCPGTLLVNLKSKQCHYPYGEKAPFEYCCRPVRDGSPYCAEHHEFCHTKQIRRKPIEIPKDGNPNCKLASQDEIDEFIDKKNESKID